MAYNPFEELCSLMQGLELKSDTASPIPAEPPRRPALPSRQQFFPIMELPTEVRCMIYEIALEQTIDHAISPPFGTPRLMPAPVCTRNRVKRSTQRRVYTFEPFVPKCPPPVGALALLHTNREIRSESADEFMRLAPVHVRALTERAASLLNSDLGMKVSLVSSLPLFKSVRERRIESAASYWVAVQDQRVALKLYAFVCHVKVGSMRVDEEEEIDNSEHGDDAFKYEDEDEDSPDNQDESETELKNDDEAGLETDDEDSLEENEHDDGFEEEYGTCENKDKSTKVVELVRPLFAPHLQEDFHPNWAASRRSRANA